MMLCGLGVMLYPTVSDWWNTMHQARLVTDYTAKVQEMSTAEYEDFLEKAQAYNEALNQLSFPFSEHSTLESQYLDALDISGNGMMGYISIPKINIELPIYHGTSDSVLNSAAGHLEGSSLPIGGESTHAVISAHRGLPTAKLFTDLNELQEGDIFTITILNETLTYQVDQILIVDPTQMEALNVIPGEDHVTLMTCTPYGINTQRLFVRGIRVPNEDVEAILASDAYKIPTYILVFGFGIPMLFILLIILLIHYSRRNFFIKATDMEAEISKYLGEEEVEKKPEKE